jgi:hypothetical protein
MEDGCRHRRVDAGTGRTSSATFSHEDAERHMHGSGYHLREPTADEGKCRATS